MQVPSYSDTWYGPSHADSDISFIMATPIKPSSLGRMNQMHSFSPQSETENLTA